MQAKKSLVAPAAVALSMLALGFGSLQSASAQTAQPTTTTYPVMRHSQTRHVERHPELRAALSDLQKARTELQEGAHDFKGERVAAIKSVDTAIAQVQQALRNDRN